MATAIQSLAQVQRSGAPDTGADVTVTDAMHAGLVSCTPDTPLSSVVAIMQDRGVHKVIVTREDRTLGGVISEADLLRHAGHFPDLSAGQVARDGVFSIKGDVPLGQVVDRLASGDVEIFVVEGADEASPIGTLTAADIVQHMARPPRQPRTVAEAMTAGVVLCDPDASAREVAAAMLASGARVVVVVDIDGETIGVIDHVAVLRAWNDPDTVTAATLMDTDTVTLGPDTGIAEAARIMAAAGQVQALVEPPVPPEESGRWSHWKERGLPRGVLTVQAVLGSLMVVAPLGPSATAIVPARPRRLGLMIALVLAIVLITILTAGYFAFTSSPACLPIQVAHGRC